MRRLFRRKTLTAQMDHSAHSRGRKTIVFVGARPQKKKKGSKLEAAYRGRRRWTPLQTLKGSSLVLDFEDRRHAGSVAQRCSLVRDPSNDPRRRVGFVPQRLLTGPGERTACLVDFEPRARRAGCQFIDVLKASAGVLDWRRWCHRLRPKGSWYTPETWSSRTDRRRIKVCIP
jgi:hypothetical protein